MSVNERWANNAHAAATTIDQYRPAAAAAAARLPSMSQSVASSDNVLTL